MTIKKYIDDPELSLEDRYKKLEEHHIEETQELYNRLKKVRAENKKLKEANIFKLIYYRIFGYEL